MEERRIRLSRCILVLIALLAPGWLHAQPAKSPAPSKLPYLVRERIERIEKLFARGEARLSAAAVAELSDPLLRVDTSGRLLLLFHSRAAVGSREKAQLEAVGAQVTATTAEMPRARGRRWPSGLGLIEAWVPAARVKEAAALPWVVAVTGVETGHADVGSVTSQGNALHQATLAQAAGIDGSGVRVGVVSDTVTNLASAVTSGDLPAGVTVLDAGTCGFPPCDEGTAMLEIIHDMAPGAALFFHASGGGVLAHVSALNALVAAGVDVISEDIAFDSEPAFQQGYAASSAQALAAGGVAIHSSAGNLGTRHTARVTAVGTGAGPDGLSGPFTGCTRDPLNVVDVDPGSGTAFDVSIPSGARLSATLQWSEPRAIFPTAGAGGFTDLDLYLMDASGTTCLAQSLSTQGDGSGDTLEQLSYLNSSGSSLAAKLVVNRAGAAGASAPPLIDLRWRNASALDSTTREGSLNPDSNYTADATSSAAADAGANTDPKLAPLESFSAAGPVHLVSTTVCAGGTYPCPGASEAGTDTFLGGGPTWTAADGVSVSGAGGFPTTFSGTSAAAPHAAACEALVRQQLTNNGVTPTNTLATARLQGTAVRRGGSSEWGAGVLSCLGGPRLLVLLDRTGSMIELRGNGHSRCRDALDLAKADVQGFFRANPAMSGSAVAVWTFADAAPTDLAGGFVDEGTALAALNALDPEGCGGSTPLADAICSASDALNAALPGSPMSQRLLAISSDGGENNSTGPCSGPSSSSGPPYDPGSWQQKVQAKLLGQNITSARFWGSVTLAAARIDSETGRALALSVTDDVFFQNLATANGGRFQVAMDDGPLPPPFFGNALDPAEIPALDSWGLAVLALALSAGALILLRRA